MSKIFLNTIAKLQEENAALKKERDEWKGKSIIIEAGSKQLYDKLVYAIAEIEILKAKKSFN